MAKKKSTTASEAPRGTRLTAALTKRIEHWANANGDDAHSETMHQLLARGLRASKRKVARAPA